MRPGTRTVGIAALLASMALVAVCKAGEGTKEAPSVGKPAPPSAPSDGKEPKPPDQSHGTTAGTLAPEVALAAVNGWLDALRTKDAAKLRELTRLPLAYKSIGKKKLCEGVVKDGAGLDAMTTCFAKKETLFLEELKRGEDLAPKVVDPGHAPKSLMKLLDKSESEQTLVSGYINGDGVTYGLLLVVAPGDSGKAGVSTFALKASFPE
jgi:hypothetical protein